MRPKKFAISSGVGACMRIFGLLPSLSDGKEYADSVSAPVGMIEDASGVEAYKSCNRVRPRFMTGVVA